MIVVVTTSTICGTDIHIWHGGMPEVEVPRILGHNLSVKLSRLDRVFAMPKLGTRLLYHVYTMRRMLHCVWGPIPILQPVAGFSVI